MTNLCLICGDVVSEVELRSSEEKKGRHSASFKLDLSLYGTSFGWIMVACSGDMAELAARELRKGTKVLVVGQLIRVSLMVKELPWWGEVIIEAEILEVIK